MLISIISFWGITLLNNNELLCRLGIDIENESHVLSPLKLAILVIYLFLKYHFTGNCLRIQLFLYSNKKISNKSIPRNKYQVDSKNLKTVDKNKFDAEWTNWDGNYPSKSFCQFSSYLINVYQSYVWYLLHINH